MKIFSMCISLMASVLVAQESPVDTNVSESSKSEVAVKAISKGMENPVSWLSKHKGGSNQEVAALMDSVMAYYLTQVPEIMIPIDFREKNELFFQEAKSATDFSTSVKSKSVPVGERKSLIMGAPMKMMTNAYEPKWDKLTQELKMDHNGGANVANLCQKDVFSRGNSNKVCITQVVYDDRIKRVEVRYEELLDNKVWFCMEFVSSDYKLGTPLNLKATLRSFYLGTIEKNHLYFVRNKVMRTPTSWQDVLLHEAWNFGRTKQDIKQRRKYTQYEDSYDFGDKKSMNRNEFISLKENLRGMYYTDAFNYQGERQDISERWEYSVKEAPNEMIMVKPPSDFKDENPLNLFK